MIDIFLKKAFYLFCRIAFAVVRLSPGNFAWGVGKIAILFGKHLYPLGVQRRTKRGGSGFQEGGQIMVYSANQFEFRRGEKLVDLACRYCPVVGFFFADPARAIVSGSLTPTGGCRAGSGCRPWDRVSPSRLSFLARVCVLGPTTGGVWSGGRRAALRAGAPAIQLLDQVAVEPGGRLPGEKMKGPEPSARGGPKAEKKFQPTSLGLA